MTKLEVARALIAARDAHLQAIAKLYDAEQVLRAAETAFLRYDNPHETVPVNAVIVDGHLITPKDGWYERNPGDRLEYLTAEILS